MTGARKVDHEEIERTVRRFADAEGVDEAEVQRRIERVTKAHTAALEEYVRDMKIALSDEEE